MSVRVCLLLIACTKSPSPPKAAERSLFQSDRAKACAAFADRVLPSLKSQQPMEPTLAGDCMTKGRVTSKNYACLMKASSADEIGTCFAAPTGTGSPDFDADKAAACGAYARHVIDLMTADLQKTMTETCMSSEMKESQYDCVMHAKSDDEFKKCL
jgi:hypothetical protein